MQLPRRPRALLREQVDRALHVPGREIDPRHRGERRVGVVRRALAQVVPLHVVEQTANVFAGQVALQGPRGVRVSHRGRQVRHAFVHHALVGQDLRPVDARAVDAHLSSPPSTCNAEPGRSDDQIGLERTARRLQPQAGFREGVDLVGDDFGAPAANGPEQITVGDLQARQALLPGVVAGREVPVDVVVGPEPGCARHQSSSRRTCVPAGAGTD